MGHVARRMCCNSFPGMQHTRICEARRARGDMPKIQVVRCTNAACRVLSYDGAAEGMVRNLPCPACQHTGDDVRNGVLTTQPSEGPVTGPESETDHG